MLERVEQNWIQARRSMPSRFEDSFSPAVAAVAEAVRAAITPDLGLLLDAGCGAMPYREEAIAGGLQYVGVDLNPIGVGAIRADLRDLSMFADSTFDTALITEVLEHLSEPSRTLSELHRVLKPGGTMIVTVPHLSRLHEMPHDYFRFTEQGLRHLLEVSGFIVLEARGLGGVFAFLGHQVATIAIGLTWHSRPLRWLCLRLLHHVVTPGALLLDRVLATGRILPLGIAALAEATGREVVRKGNGSKT